MQISPLELGRRRKKDLTNYGGDKPENSSSKKKLDRHQCQSVCVCGINNLVEKSSKLGALEDRTLIGSNQLLPNAISVCVCF
jgi:hypothetical protein